MTDKELSQLNSLRIEVKQLGIKAEEIQTAILAAKGQSVFDVVRGSSCNFPYILHDIIMQGYREGDTEKKSELQKIMSRIKVDVKLKTIEFMREYERLSKYILSIDDSEMRRILTYRYVEGLTWQQVAVKMGEFDESYPRQKAKRFLKLTEKTE